MKQHTVFFPESIVSQLRNNPAAKAHANDAAHWASLDSDELSSLMFSHTIKRSWMVLSYGTCPSCGGHVPMYEWKVDPVDHPWKLSCPHCDDRFPKNDFHAFYNSGLDEKGVFRRELADESLLVGPDGTGFGVDDGDGYVDAAGNRYRFIGAWLIYGQWYGLVLAGIERLSLAYLVSGEVAYARKAATLLFRVAERFPDFDFHTQGVMYEEERTSRGYVTYWAGTPRDLQTMALGYDMIYEAIADDEELAASLGVSTREICSTIEDRIFSEAIPNRPRYHSNPPHTDLAIVVMKSVLAWPENREEVLEGIDSIIAECTAVDGLSGEKGIAGYTSIAPSHIAELLLLFSQVSDRFLEEMIERYPVLRKTYRFHIDTWYRNRYYPGVGDATGFGAVSPRYLATLRGTERSHPYLRSRDWFTFRLCELFDDPDFAKALYLSHGGSIESCFADDLYLPDPSPLRRTLESIITETGTEIDQTTVHYDEWRIALLYAGSGASKRMLCINYDSGANHAHDDALNIGLFAYGSNLLPDFGYPPVHYGGWATPEFKWYRHPASHNLVVIDGKEHEQLAEGSFIRRPEYGVAEVYGANRWAQIVRADAKEYAGVSRYERTVAMIDIDESRSYVFDLFRVSGGDDHTMFLRTPPAAVSTRGITTRSGEAYGHGTYMRGFQTDPSPEAGSRITFDYELVPETLEHLGLSVTSLTEGAEITLCESWVDTTRVAGSSGWGDLMALWIPTIMTRKSGPESVFIQVLEPFVSTPGITRIRPVAVSEPEARGFSIDFDTGASDVIVFGDPADPGTIRCDEEAIETDGWFAIVRKQDRIPVSQMRCGGTRLTVG